MAKNDPKFAKGPIVQYVNIPYENFEIPFSLAEAKPQEHLQTKKAL